MKVAKVKAHNKRKKSGGVKRIRQHQRKIKTAAEAPGAGKAIKVKKSGAVPPAAMPGNKPAKFKTPMHERMAALRAMRKK